MARTYAQIEDVVQQMLQDTTPSTYDTTETGYWIEECLKEFSHYIPHIVSVVFKIESRTGTDTAGTTSSLTDTTKSQFVAGDATNEKVVHNTTDHTWAVVLANSSTSVNTLSADIMASGDEYEIYNKRCWNKKQIFIGDVTDYLWIDSVEYPIGTKRNWKVYGEVLEIDANSIADSDSTLTSLGKTEVLVRFAKPHRLCQLTDLEGTCLAIEPVGETSLSLTALGVSEVVEIGDELNIANKRYTYTVTKGVALTSEGVGVVTVFPGMEAATAVGEVVTFVKSTLKPQHEELFCHLVAARAVLSDNINYINAVNKGGPETYARFRDWGERKLAEVLSKLDRISTPRTRRVYPK